VKSEIGDLIWLVERCQGPPVTPAHVPPGRGLQAGKDASKPTADVERGYSMKQQETRSPKVGEPRNGNSEQKKRFLIVKLEERIAPGCHYKGYKRLGKCCSA
jgi:hypothetical protein